NVRLWVRSPHGALLALGGRSSPDLQCSGGLSPGPFCVEFACSPRVHKGFPPLRIPTEKHAEEQNTLLSVPDHLTWSPGAYRLPTAPGVLEEGWSGMGQMQSVHFTATSGLRVFVCVCVCVCVSCVASIKYTCVLQCAACGNKRTDGSQPCLLKKRKKRYIVQHNC